MDDDKAIQYNNMSAPLNCTGGSEQGCEPFAVCVLVYTYALCVCLYLHIRKYIDIYICLYIHIYTYIYLYEWIKQQYGFYLYHGK